MSLLMKDVEHSVSDGAGNHVHNKVGRAVVGCRSITEMEGGWSIPFNDVVEVNLHSSFVQFAGDKGANQASAQAMNPHGPPSPLWLSKVPAPRPRSFLYGEEIIYLRTNQGL
jgi:hypothetical protein